MGIRFITSWAIPREGNIPSPISQEGYYSLHVRIHTHNSYLLQYCQIPEDACLGLQKKRDYGNVY